VDDDVVPTLLNEGRGETLPIFAPCQAVVVVVREERHVGSPNVERRVQVPFWEDDQTGFPVAHAAAVAMVGPRTGRAAGVRVKCVSNVIYQNVYLIRLINVSGLLSNYIPLIYQIAR